MRYMSEKDFFEKLNQTSYGQEYLNFINQILAEQRTPKVRKDGYDLHHIQPKALGGLNSKLVKLSAFEHCKAHALLAKAIPCLETLYPVKTLSVGQVQTLSDLDKVSLEDLYEWSKLVEEWRKINGIQNRGRVWTEEQRKEASLKRKGRKAWNKGIHYKNLGKEYHLSEKGLKNIQESNAKKRGKIRISKGLEVRVVSKSTLPSFVKEGWTVGGGSTKQKGSVHIHRKNERKMVSKDRLQFFIDQGWKKGRGIPAPNLGKPHTEETKRKIQQKALERSNDRKQFT